MPLTKARGRPTDVIVTPLKKWYYLAILRGVDMPETWRPIAGFPAYEVSDHGRVRSLRFKNGNVDRLRAKPMILKPSGSRYLSVSLCLDGVSVTHPIHALVLTAFVGPRPDRLVARHLDGDPHQNLLTNLAWGTQLENHADRERHGRTARGESGGNTKLTEADVRAIRADGRPKTRIAADYGVSDMQITRIKMRESWAHVTV